MLLYLDALSMPEQPWCHAHLMPSSFRLRVLMDEDAVGKVVQLTPPP
jgi:hypothetical protein